MGIPTLIKTQTASDSAYLDFIDGTSDVVLDSTYDEYMFVFTDVRPEVNGVEFTFQVNATDDAGGSYDSSNITSTCFTASHNEAGTSTSFAYVTGFDQAQTANFQVIAPDISNGGDKSAAGILHLFSPSSTTYVKHFYCRSQVGHFENYSQDHFTSGYINDTTAIDEIRFKVSSDNFNGVIQLYGIS